jgi:hypothetical protein
MTLDMKNVAKFSLRLADENFPLSFFFLSALRFIEISP